MQRSTKFAGILVAGLAAGAVTAAANPFAILEFFMELAEADASERASAKDVVKSTREYEYVTIDLFTQVSNRGPDNGFFVQPVPVPLIGDFTLWTTVAPNGPDAPSIFPGFAGFELDESFSSPLQFFGIFCQPGPEANLVFAARNGNSNLGSVQFPPGGPVDLMMEVVSGDVDFFARPSGVGAEWSPVASTTLTNPGEIHHVSLGAASMASGGSVRVDPIAIVGHTPAATDSVRGDVTVATGEVRAALDRAKRACEGFSPDVPELTDALGDASSAIDAAIAALNALSETDPRRAAIKPLEKAKKDVVKAQEKLAKGKPAKAILASVNGALKDEGKAVNALRLASLVSE
jgi:hypothetical protein